MSQHLAGEPQPLPLRTGATVSLAVSKIHRAFTSWVGAVVTVGEAGQYHQVEQTAFEPVVGTTGRAPPSLYLCPAHLPGSQSTQVRIPLLVVYMLFCLHSQKRNFQIIICTEILSLHIKYQTNTFIYGYVQIIIQTLYTYLCRVNCGNSICR